MPAPPPHHRVRRGTWRARLVLPALLTAGLWVACNGSDPADGDTSTPGPDENAVPTWSYRVVARYPHDTRAFTQGLVYDGGVLLEGTGGGRRLASRHLVSSLREVDLETGAVRDSLTLDTRYFGEGVALLQGRVYQLTWLSRLGFVYDRAGFARLDSFSYQSEGWGLTTDGTRLIMSDGSATLTFRDPDTFAVTGAVEVTHEGRAIVNLNELEWIEGEVWANIWGSDIVARIDPASGAVVGWIDLRGLLSTEERRAADVLNGIAWDASGRRLFVTGKLWPWLFEITLER